MRDKKPFSRRLILTSAIAVGGLGFAISQTSRLLAERQATPTPECRDHDDPTEAQIEGPFFKPRSPMRDNLVEPGTRGMLYRIEGRVLTRSCRPVPGALLDLWHANETGDYDDKGFRYRGHVNADAAARFRFQTILPGPYPGRTRHYHFKVQAPRGRILTTQLYFPDEPDNDYDFFFSPELLLRVSPGAGIKTAQFDFILDLA